MIQNPVATIPDVVLYHRGTSQPIAIFEVSVLTLFYVPAHVSCLCYTRR